MDSHENEIWGSLIQEPLLEQDKKYYVVLLRSNFVGTILIGTVAAITTTTATRTSENNSETLAL